jgi:hypothetical protein
MAEQERIQPTQQQQLAIIKSRLDQRGFLTLIPRREVLEVITVFCSASIIMYLKLRS